MCGHIRPWALKGWREYDCFTPEFMMCGCQHPQQMYLQLRGLCSESYIDRFFVPRNGPHPFESLCSAVFLLSYFLYHLFHAFLITFLTLRTFPTKKQKRFCSTPWHQNQYYWLWWQMANKRGVKEHNCTIWSSILFFCPGISQLGYYKWQQSMQPKRRILHQTSEIDRV